MDKSKSLQELEGYDAGNPENAPTDMIRRCLQLHRTPLNQWSAEDCRLMLGQKFSPQFLVPLALEWLGKDPLQECDFYPGDLLQNVLGLPAEFWINEQDLWWLVNEIVSEVEALRRSIEDLTPAIKTFQTLMGE